MEFNILKFITLKRFFNIIKIFSSYIISVITKKVVVWGKPLTLSIEPTNRCNLLCPECPSGTGELTRNLGNIDYKNYCKIIDQIKDHVFYIQLFFQGEPFINKNIYDMINYARQNKIYVSISTNGLLLNDKNIEKLMQYPPDKLIFSIDGMSEETYKIYRVGGDFNKVINNLKNLLNKKNELKQKLPFIELQFIAMKQNEHEINKVIEMGKKLRVNKTVIKSMQVNSYQSALEFLPENPKYSRYYIKEEKLYIKNKLKNKCFALWRSAVITWNGIITPCCFDKDAKYNLGNILEEDFCKIWKNKKYNNFRQAILRNRKGIDICTNCTEGLNMNLIEK